MRPVEVKQYSGWVLVWLLVCSVCVRTASAYQSLQPVAFSKGQITVNYQNGGVNNQRERLTLSTTGNQPLEFAFVSTADPLSGQNWMVVDPLSGTIPGGGSVSVTIGYDATTGLALGFHSGGITVLVPGGSPSQHYIPVSLLVSGSPLLNSPASGLTFWYGLGGVVPPGQSAMASSTNALPGSLSGQMAITISASTTSGGNWLLVPASGATGSPFPIAIDPGGLASGRYEGAITIRSDAAGNFPQPVPVTLTVVDAAVLQTDVSALFFPYQIGEPVLPSQLVRSVAVASSTEARLLYTAHATALTCDGAWLTLGGSTTGMTAGTFVVRVTPTGLGPGTCGGTVTVGAINAVTGDPVAGSPAIIPVMVYVSKDPLLVVTPADPITFTVPVGAVPSFALLGVGTTDHTNFSYGITTAVASRSASWLSFPGPLAAPGPDVQVAVRVDLDRLSAGTYSGIVSLAGALSATPTANSPVTIPITLRVTESGLSPTPPSLSFSLMPGTEGLATQRVTLSSPFGSLAFSVGATTHDGGSWLTAGPANGSTPSDVQVSVGAAGLAEGTYDGMVTITPAGTTYSPVGISVKLRVIARRALPRKR